MPPPLSSPRGSRSAFCRRANGNVAAVSHGQHGPPLQPPDAPTRRWAKRPGDLDLWPFDLESGVRVMCDVGYLCANFGQPRPLCSRRRPDVRDRQTSDVWQTDVRRQIKASRNASAYYGRGLNKQFNILMNTPSQFLRRPTRSSSTLYQPRSFMSFYLFVCLFFPILTSLWH